MIMIYGGTPAFFIYFQNQPKGESLIMKFIKKYALKILNILFATISFIIILYYSKTNNFSYFKYALILLFIAIIISLLDSFINYKNKS